jgi:chromate transporter
MTLDPPRSAPHPVQPGDVTLGALFLAFVEIALSSFGGALAWARRVLVERRGWLGAREFGEMLGLCQALPGPNVVNLSIFLGTRYHGLAGAAVAFAGFILVPLVVVLLPLALLYSYGGHLDLVRAALRGVASAAAGLLLATGLKMAWPYRREPWALAIAALALVGVGLLHWPLLAVVAALAPVSIGLAWRRGA